MIILPQEVSWALIQRLINKFRERKIARLNVNFASATSFKKLISNIPWP